MIPPSNPFVVYGIARQASVDKLFLAGIVPGILTGLVLILTTYFIARRHGWRGERKEHWLQNVLAATWQAKWALLVPISVLGASTAAS